MTKKAGIILPFFAVIICIDNYKNRSLYIDYKYINLVFVVYYFFFIGGSGFTEPVTAAITAGRISSYFAMPLLTTSSKLTGAVAAALAAMPDFKAYFQPNECGITAFSCHKMPSEELAQTLSDKFGIAVRGGLHCAPLIHKALGTHPEGLVRASFSPFQSMREVNALISALRHI